MKNVFKVFDIFIISLGVFLFCFLTIKYNLIIGIFSLLIYILRVKYTYKYKLSCDIVGIFNIFAWFVGLFMLIYVVIKMFCSIPF